MIGDTVHGINMGKNANINTIGVTWAIIIKKNYIEKMPTML